MYPHVVQKKCVQLPTGQHVLRLADLRPGPGDGVPAQHGRGGAREPPLLKLPGRHALGAADIRVRPEEAQG